MSADSSIRKSHAMLCVITVMSVLVLYVATWPVVKIKGTTWVPIPAYGRHKEYSGYRQVQSPWMNALYLPLDALSSIDMENNPLGQYYEWWCRRLQSSLFPLP